MADPISIVGLITGVVELADMVFVRTFLYVKAVKEGDKERLSLNSEVGALYGILSRLQLLSGAMEGGEEEEEEEEKEDCKPVLQAVHLNNCLKTLLTIKSKLDAHEGDGHATGRRALRSALKAVRWPFTSSEVGDLLVEIERHKTNLSLALAADGLSRLLQALSTQGEICATVRGIESELNRGALNEQRRQILDSFGSTDPGKNHDMSRKLWHPCTGLWLTNGPEFRDWLTNKTAKNIWCHGIPGSGKTVLASALIEEVLKCRSHSVAAAYFYCDYKDVNTQDPANILGSLAKQLIRQSERCFKESEAFYEVHHSGKQVSISYRPGELRDLVVQMSSFFNRTMIVVDGLDECGKDTTTVIELLSSLSKSEISSVQTLFLSRDEIEIRETLTDYNPVSIAANKGDLQLYVAAELGSRMKSRRLHINNKSIREHIMDRLVNGANGMFRWAACQIDYLCELPDDRERCRALETLPPDLKSTYERILRRVHEMHISVQRLVQRTLRWLIVAKGMLTISAWREALSMEDGISKLDRDAVPDEFVLLRSCSSLVRRSAGGQGLELAHFTVKEFLLGIDSDSEFSAYRFDAEESEVELGKACLTYLTLQDFNSTASWSREAELKRYQEYPFRGYAVKHWLSHVGGRQGDPGLFALIKKLFDPSRPGTFRTWIRDYTSHSRYEVYPSSWTPAYIEWIRAQIDMDTPLHYASAFALPEICKWLLECGCKVNHMGRFGTPIFYVIGGPELPAGHNSSCGEFFGPNESRKGRMLEVIDMLLEAGADPTSKSTYGNAPLFYALIAPEVVLRLLRKGATFTDELESRRGPKSTVYYAHRIIERFGRENLHEDDYAYLLQLIENDADWGLKAMFE